MNKERKLIPFIESGITYLSGIFTILDEPNERGLIHDAMSFRRIVSNFKSKLLNNKISGEIGHPNYNYVNSEIVSHWIEDIYYNPENNCIEGKILIADTEEGNKILNKLNDGKTIYVSFRGDGDFKENKLFIKQIFTYDIFFK